MPSSKNRRPVELPTALYARLAEEAALQRRTVASVATELIEEGLRRPRRSYTVEEMRAALTEEAGTPSPERDAAERWFGPH